MMHKAWCCLGEVPYYLSRSSIKFQGHTATKFWLKLGVSGLLLQFKFTNGYEMMHKAWSSIDEVPYFFFKVIHQISSPGIKCMHLLSLEILNGQIRKEVNIPIMISIFTQFILYDVMWDMLMCAARYIKGSIIISWKITAHFSFSNIPLSNCLLDMTE